MSWESVMVAAVWGSGDWSDDTLSMPGFVLGQGWQRFGIPEARLTGAVMGQDVMRLLQQHDHVILQHWAPAEFIERVESNGVTRVTLWVAFEAVSARPTLSTLSLGLWWTGRLNSLSGLTANRFGNYYVDMYESATQPWPDKPHAIACDVCPPYAGQYISALSQTWGMARYEGKVKRRIFVDSVLDRPYYGTASNAPEIDEKRVDSYRRGTHDLLDLASKLGWQVFGNSHARQVLYPELDMIWDERFFITNRSGEQALEAIEYWDATRKNPHQRLCLVADPFDVSRPWGMGDAEWGALSLVALRQNPPGKLALCTARTGHFLFVPDGFPW